MKGVNSQFVILAVIAAAIGFFVTVALSKSKFVQQIDGGINTGA